MSTQAKLPRFPVTRPPKAISRATEGMTETRDVAPAPTKTRPKKSKYHHVGITIEEIFQFVLFIPHSKMI